MYKLYIDIREKPLYNSIKQLYINNPIDDSPFESHIFFKILDVGDIIITDENDTTILIFERKSVADMLSSIKDGRYLEQSFRLQNTSLDNHMITYIIEGNINIPQKNIIISSIFSLNYNKKFSTLRTNNVNETATFLFQYFKKIKKQKDLTGLKENISSLQDKTYIDVIKTSKKSNITKENICEIMLSQIPGISTQCAKTIAKSYTTIVDLIIAMQEDDSCLDNLKIETKNSNRKISKTAIQNIKIYLMQ
tara:strand:+ start:165 stop:914 length:750 start_codon:yes stop_codon:yes gene_type:complete